MALNDIYIGRAENPVDPDVKFSVLFSRLLLFSDTFKNSNFEVFWQDFDREKFRRVLTEFWRDTFCELCWLNINEDIFISFSVPQVFRVRLAQKFARCARSRTHGLNGMQFGGSTILQVPIYTGSLSLSQPGGWYGNLVRPCWGAYRLQGHCDIWIYWLKSWQKGSFLWIGPLLHHFESQSRWKLYCSLQVIKY